MRILVLYLVCKHGVCLKSCPSGLRDAHLGLSPMVLGLGILSCVTQVCHTPAETHSILPKKLAKIMSGLVALGPLSMSMREV